MNIVVPMAGRGSRFQNVGFTLPKPLIPVNGIPMIKMVINNLRPQRQHRFIFLTLAEHIQKYQIDQKLLQWAPNSQIITVSGVTEGAACTVLLAEQYINNAQPLMIANSDQWVDTDINSYLDALTNADGLIMTMTANHPKWSYLRLDSNRQITEVVEKEVVSDLATVGIYNFRCGSDFVTAAKQMIAKNLRVNNEFYVAPCYNQMLAAGKRLTYYNIGKEFDGMYGVGTPEDLQRFLDLPISKKATA